MFSSLVSEITGTTNRLYLQRDELVSRGVSVVDLIKGNVTEHGITFPPDIMREILAEAADRARVYKPDSFGQKVARDAVSKFYSESGVRVLSENIVLTPGTSVSFWYCFKLLAQPGDEILCPCPSYPLFDTIAQLCGINLVTYPLDETRDWAIDLDSLEESINEKTRALVLISPHNPTGMVADDEQICRLAYIAVRHELPIISDEVFSDFLFGVKQYPRISQTNAPLVFTLNGFSKTFALPGMKLGWIAVSGEQSAVARSLSALEMISDTFLPVSEISQFAAPMIFDRGRDFRKQYVSTIAQCRDAAVGALDILKFSATRGGFYLTIPIDRDEDETTMQLLEQENILVHPGYFYDIDGRHIVTTFIHNPDEVRHHFETIARFLHSVNAT